MSKEEEQHAAALAAVEANRKRAADAADALAAAQQQQALQLTLYQPYIVEGMGASADALTAFAQSDVQLRAVIWAHPPAPAVDAAAAAETLATDAAAAEAAAPPPPPPPPPPPELWAAMRQACLASGWDGAAGGVAAIEVVFPAPLGPVAPPPEEENPKKGAAAKKDPKKKAEEEAAPAAPPPDVPGWELLGGALSRLCHRVRAYKEWRSRVKVRLLPGSAPLPYHPPLQMAPVLSKTACALPGAQVYDATEAEPLPSTAYYSSLLDTVLPERISVPLMLHAMLEQVARNAQVRAPGHTPCPGIPRPARKLARCRAHAWFACIGAARHLVTPGSWAPAPPRRPS